MATTGLSDALPLTGLLTPAASMCSAALTPRSRSFVPMYAERSAPAACISVRPELIPSTRTPASAASRTAVATSSDCAETTSATEVSMCARIVAACAASLSYHAQSATGSKSAPNVDAAPTAFARIACQKLSAWAPWVTNLTRSGENVSRVGQPPKQAALAP